MQHASPIAVPRSSPASHSILREGAIAGAIGATAIALWFLCIDLFAGQPLRTPEVLGRGLLSVLGPSGSEGAMTYVAAYTLFHYLAFAALGILVAQIFHWAEKEPTLLAGALILFVAAEIGFYGLVGLLSEPGILGGFAWYQVMAANLIAAALMGGYLWRRHPALAGKLNYALSGKE